MIRSNFQNQEIVFDSNNEPFKLLDSEGTTRSISTVPLFSSYPKSKMFFISAYVHINHKLKRDLWKTTSIDTEKSK